LVNIYGVQSYYQAMPILSTMLLKIIVDIGDRFRYTLLR